MRAQERLAEAEGVDRQRPRQHRLDRLEHVERHEADAVRGAVAAGLAERAHDAGQVARGGDLEADVQRPLIEPRLLRRDALAHLIEVDPEGRRPAGHGAERDRPGDAAAGDLEARAEAAMRHQRDAASGLDAERVDAAAAGRHGREVEREPARAVDRHRVAGTRGAKRLAGNRVGVAALPEREAQTRGGAVFIRDEEDLDPGQVVLGGGEHLHDPQPGGQVEAVVPLGLLAGDGIERKHCVSVGVVRLTRASATRRGAESGSHDARPGHSPSLRLRWAG